MLGGSFVDAELLQLFAKSSDKVAGHFLQVLISLFTCVAEHGLPPSWTVLTLISLHKKGDKTVQGNYRGLAVMPVLPKLYVTCL